MSLISSTNQEVPYLSEQVFNCSRASVHCHSPHIQTLLLQINQRGNMDMQGATATMWTSRLSRAILCSDINTAFSVWKTFWGFRKAIFQPARWALVSGKQKILYRTLNNRRHTRGKKKIKNWWTNWTRTKRSSVCGLVYFSSHHSPSELCPNVANHLLTLKFPAA